MSASLLGAEDAVKGTIMSRPSQCSFPRAPVTKYSKWSILKQQALSLIVLGARSPRSRCRQGSAPSETCRNHALFLPTPYWFAGNLQWSLACSWLTLVSSFQLPHGFPYMRLPLHGYLPMRTLLYSSKKWSSLQRRPHSKILGVRTWNSPCVCVWGAHFSP